MIGVCNLSSLQDVSTPITYLSHFSRREIDLGVFFSWNIQVIGYARTHTYTSSGEKIFKWIPPGSALICLLSAILSSLNWVPPFIDLLFSVVLNNDLYALSMLFTIPLCSPQHKNRICIPVHLLSILVAGDSPVGNFLPESSPEEPPARLEWRKRPRLRVSQLSGPVGVHKTSSLSIWISSSLGLGAWRPNHQKVRVGSHLIVQPTLKQEISWKSAGSAEADEPRGNWR